MIGWIRSGRGVRAEIVTLCVAVGIATSVSVRGSPSALSRHDSSAPRGTIALATTADFRTILLISPGSGVVTHVRAPDQVLGLQVDLSPDGSRLAFGGTKAIWTMSRRGRRARQVVRVSPTARYAPDWVVWSPSGSEIAFTRGGALYRVTANGSRLVRVLGGQNYGPDWSARGFIAFVRNPSLRTGAGLIQTVRPNGTGLRSVVRGGHPDVSPDGSAIAFSRRDGIYVMPLAGGRPRRVAVRGDHPEWSPDGRHLAFTREVRCGDAGCEGRVFIVPAGGGQPRAVGPRVFEVGPLSWSR